MELDDLRRQWQQPDPVTPVLDPASLNRLLAQRSDSQIELMRRNARLEAGFAALMAVAAPLLLRFASTYLMRVQLVALFLLALVMLGYYYRKLQLLRQLAQPDADVRAHLQRLAVGLRRLLRFNYRLTVAVGPASLLVVYEVVVGQELQRPGGFRTGLVLGVGAALLVGGLLLQWAMVRFARWYLQRLYGQHLDRLEANLRELDDDATA